MYDIMGRAKNAIEAYNDALRVASSNIANLSTAGYKRMDVSFQSIYERLIRAGTPADTFANLGGTDPMQLGQSVAIGSTALDMSAGTLTASDNIDLAINGIGFFIVSPDGGNTYYYTRNGDFSVDASGYLTSNGMPVYGFSGGGSTLAPIQLPAGQRDTANLSWQGDGTLLFNNASTGYRIALTYFYNPQGLAQAQGTAFAETLASGSPATAAAPGGTAGSLTVGHVEGSNVSYLTETIKSLELQRNISANLTMIRAASDIISQFINRLG